MELYAIKIQKSQLPLITLLNEGVTPSIEGTHTWFIFDATWNSEIPNEIVTHREFLQRDLAGWQPLVFKLKNKK